MFPQPRSLLGLGANAAITAAAFGITVVLILTQHRTAQLDVDQIDLIDRMIMITKLADDADPAIVHAITRSIRSSRLSAEYREPSAPPAITVTADPPPTPLASLDNVLGAALSTPERPRRIRAYHEAMATAAAVELRQGGELRFQMPDQTLLTRLAWPLPAVTFAVGGLVAMAFLAIIRMRGIAAQLTSGFEQPQIAGDQPAGEFGAKSTPPPS